VKAPWEAFGFLVGTWVGEGKGEYPTIESFSYREEITFSPVPTKGFLAYQQKTWKSDTDQPLHSESGYLRPADGGVELVLAQPTGLVELHNGAISGDETSHRIDFVSTLVTGTPTAVDVTAVERSIEVTGDSLTYRMRMRAVGQPLTHHLAATLTRQTDVS